MFKFVLRHGRSTITWNSFAFCQAKEPKSQNPPEVTPKDFSLIDIRIGEIVECWKVLYNNNKASRIIEFIL